MPYIPRHRTANRFWGAIPWYQRPGGAARLDADRARLLAAYPELAIEVNDTAKRVIATGAIGLVTPVSRIRTSINLRIAFPVDYAKGEPIAYETAERFERGHLDGHVLSNGQLCLWLPARSPWYGRDRSAGWSCASPDALVRYVDQVAVFCERYLVYEAGGKKHWPGPKTAHAADGYVEYLRETLELSDDELTAFAIALLSSKLESYDPCPCGAGKKYRFCHEPRIREAHAVCGDAFRKAFILIAHRAAISQGD